MHHYAFNIGDYIKDTVHLDLIQHGAYRRLLDWYYASETPLPDDLTFLARVCGAQTAVEKKAVDMVLRNFFKLNGKTWQHKRVEKEIGKYRAKSKAGSAGMESRYQDANELDNGFDNKPDNRSDNKPPKNQYAHDNQEPRTKNQEPVLLLEADASEPETAVLNWSKDYGWRGVTDTMRQEWKLAYPACDPDTQLARMDQWLKANPQKSMKKLWLKFVTGWMSRSQESGGDLPRNPVNSTPGFGGQKKEGGAAAAPVKLVADEPAWDWQALHEELFDGRASVMWGHLAGSVRYELRTAYDQKKNEGGANQ